jgi:hypothetical protein
MPFAFVLAAVHSPLSVVVNPLVAARAIARLKFDYVAALVVFWGLFAASWWVDSIAGGLSQLVPVPVVPRVFAEAMKLVLPLVSARLLGLLLYARRGELGYGVAIDYLVPALGDLEPAEKLAPVQAATPGPELATSLPEATALARILPLQQRCRPEAARELPMLPSLPELDAPLQAPAEDLLSEEEFSRLTGASAPPPILAVPEAAVRAAIEKKGS